MEAINYGQENRMHFNQMVISGWYPSNLVAPVKANGDVFKRDKKETKQVDLIQLEDNEKRNKRIIKLRNEIKVIKKNPINRLSAEHDDFGYVQRLVPLYRSHLAKNF